MAQHIEVSYKGALLAAGATVHAFREFGSYQGDWWARVTYKGETGWVSGSYGSCSGCDALQAEFDAKYGYEFGETHTWGDDDPAPREKTSEELAREREDFAEFGRSYLEDMILTQEEALKRAGRNADWDMEAENVLAFLREVGG